MTLSARIKGFFSGKTANSARLASTAMIARMLQQITTFFIAIFAARFLEPAEFGIYTLAVAFTLLLQTITFTGLYDFIIASKDEEKAVRSTAFWLMMIISALGAAILFFTASLLAQWFNAPELAEPLQWLAVNQPLAATVAWISAVLLREEKLDTHYHLMILQNLISFAVGVALLIYWQSVFALVAHRFARSFAGIVLYYGWCRIGPGLHYSRELARKALAYSTGLYGARFLTFMSQNAAVFVLGLVLSAEQLGVFRFGERLAMAGLSVLTEPMRSFAITRFGAENRVDRSLVPAFNQFLPTMLILVGCAAGAIGVFAGPVVVEFFKPSYMPSAPIAGAIALSVLASVIHLLLDPFLAATGNTGRLFWFQLSVVISGIAALAITVPFGIEAVAWSRVAVSLGASIGAVVVLRRVSEENGIVQPGKVLAALSLVAIFTASAWALNLASEEVAVNSLVRLCLALGLSGLICLAILAFAVRLRLFVVNAFTG